MLTDFVFDFEVENEKVLVGRYRLVEPIFGAKYVQLVGFVAPYLFDFVVTCDLIDDFLSNNEHNKGEPVIGMSKGGGGEYRLIPITRDYINEITVRILSYSLSASFLLSFSRLILRIFQEEPTSLLEMKQCSF